MAKRRKEPESPNGTDDGRTGSTGFAPPGDRAAIAHQGCSSNTQMLNISPDDPPPSYDDIVTLPAHAPSHEATPSRNGSPMGARTAPAPAMQYARDLAIMQKALKKRAKHADDVSRRLRLVRDVDDAQDIIAGSLLEVLGVLPESAVTTNDSAVDILAAYQSKCTA